jgi:DNA-binding beta-propeller fold protein YncE
MRRFIGAGAALAVASVLFVPGGARADGPGGFEVGPVPAVLGGHGVTAIVGAPLDSGGNQIYLADRAGIERRDVGGGEAGVPVSTEIGFSGLALTSDGSLLYATQPVADRVAVFDTATNTVVRRMNQFGTAMKPTAIAVSPDGSRLYTASSVYSSISVLSATTGYVQRTIPAPAGMGTASALSLTEDGRRLYVADSTQGTVWSVDTATYTSSVTASGLGGPLKSLTVSDDGLTGYAAVGGDAPSLKTIDIAKGVAIHSAPLGEVPSTTALLWLNQVLVALPSQSYIDTYYAPFAPEPELLLDRIVNGPVVGGTEQVEPRPMSPGITFTYQWYAGHYSASARRYDGQPVPGATSRAFHPTEAQMGAEMRVFVYAHGVGLAPNSTFCDFANPVLGPMLPRTPIINGRAAVGSTVRAKVGSWGPHTRVGFSYQWFAGKKAIRGATRARLRIGKATAGKKLQLRVTGKQYTARKSALSRYTKKVKRRASRT